MRVIDVFKLHNAQSEAFSKHQRGDVAFITNGLANNGIIGYINPLPKDKVFNFSGLCISAFCEATIHKPRFVARGNGGSKLTVLEPIGDLSERQLVFYAAYFNEVIRWRFSYGRMVTGERLKNMEIPNPPSSISIGLAKDNIPYRVTNTHSVFSPNRIKQIPISDLFTDVISGEYHAEDELEPGDIPLISCGWNNNGIVDFFNIPKEHIHSNALTIAYNGLPLNAHYHAYEFGAKDDIAVCIPFKDCPISTIIYIQCILNGESWRFSYGRKCFNEKMKLTAIPMPVTNDDLIDHQSIKNLVTRSKYWDFVEKQYVKGLKIKSASFIKTEEIKVDDN